MSRQCQTCGEHVTVQFARTHGDRDGVVHRCLRCDTRERLHRGSAAGLDCPKTDPLDEKFRFKYGDNSRNAPPLEVADD